MSFASLRANEFIWTAVVNNYLKGENAPPIDLLYWTNDQPNLPGAWFLYYIRNMYLENNLARPGCLEVGGTPVDLGKIDMPAYVLGARDDHIVPWKCTYASARLLGGEVEYVVGASGHVAGIVNPPAAGKRNHWVGGDRGGDADRWLASAESRPGELVAALERVARAAEAARRSPRARSSGTRVTSRSSPLRAGTYVPARRGAPVDVRRSPQ